MDTTMTKLAVELDPGDIIPKKNRRLRVFEISQTALGVTVRVQDEQNDSIATLRYNIGDEVEVEQ